MINFVFNLFDDGVYINENIDPCFDTHLFVKEPGMDEEPIELIPATRSGIPHTKIRENTSYIIEICTNPG